MMKTSPFSLKVISYVLLFQVWNVLIGSGYIEISYPNPGIESEMVEDNQGDDELIDLFMNDNLADIALYSDAPELNKDE